MRHRQIVQVMRGEVSMYKVVEKFISINGEGRFAGQLAVFIRFAGCNLECSYCDTRWANRQDVEYEAMTHEEIYEYIKSSGVRNITLTGGEPLLQEKIFELLAYLSEDRELSVEVETNGSIELTDFTEKLANTSFTMDYKLQSSDMEGKMLLDNLKTIRKQDTLKFVAGDFEDLRRAKEVIDKYDLCNKTRVYLSPVFGKIEMSDIVEFMIENKMNKVNLQVQLHKVIWDAYKRGV